MCDKLGDQLVSRLTSSKMPKPKLCKVRVGSRDHPYYGVAAQDIKELKKKAAISAGVDKSRLGKLRREGDDVIVADEDYFQSLKDDTRYYFEQSNSDALREGISRFRETLDRSGIDLHSTPAGDPSLNQLLTQIDKRVLSMDRPVSNKDSRDEHPEWFEGLPEKKKSKRQVMREKAKDRVQGYFYEALREIKNLDIGESKRKKLIIMTDMWKQQLKRDEWFSSYFDCSDPGHLTFCRDFFCWCEGAWNRNNCRFGHHTNPYWSYDMRIRFQTWNLDHRIEKTRTVLHRLCELMDKHEKLWDKMKEHWSETFYKLWFTKHNLKMVDIVCHDKREHDIDVDISDPRNVQFDELPIGRTRMCTLP